MPQHLAALVVHALYLYLGVGAIFAVPFVTLGVGRIDPAARQGTVGFRILVYPASVALWPLLAWRWARSDGSPPTERSPHRTAARRRAEG